MPKTRAWGVPASARAITDGELCAVLHACKGQSEYGQEHAHVGACEMEGMVCTSRAHPPCRAPLYDLHVRAGFGGVVFVMEKTRDISFGALLGRNPEVGAASIWYDFELLRWCSDCDVDVVLSVHEVVNGHIARSPGSVEAPFLLELWVLSHLMTGRILLAHRQSCKRMCTGSDDEESREALHRSTDQRSKSRTLSETFRYVPQIF